MSCRKTEAGIAFVVALLIMFIVIVLGTAIAVATRGSSRTATAFKNQQIAFEAAMTGLEQGREALRYRRYIDTTLRDFGPLLTVAAGGASLVDSRSLLNFNATNGFTNLTSPSNVPLIAPATLPNGASYQVFLTNGGAEAPTVLADSDDTVTLTAFGSGPNQVGFSVVQGVFSPVPGVPNLRLPGILTMPGRHVDVEIPTSATPAQLDGDGGGTPEICYATIAVSGNAATADVATAMGQPGAKPNALRTCNPSGGADLSGIASSDNFISGVSPYDGSEAANTPVFQAATPDLTSIAFLNSLLAQIAAKPPDYRGAGTGSINLGSAADPRVVYIDGDFAMSGASMSGGAGTLVVTGKLTMSGNVNYRGSIYVVGTGWVERNGSGSAVSCGGILIANTAVPDSIDTSRVGTPKYEISGGGSSNYGACPQGEDGDVSRFGEPLRRLSFQQLR